jgi:hypothetical protein
MDTQEMCERHERATDERQERQEMQERQERHLCCHVGERSDDTRVDLSSTREGSGGSREVREARTTPCSIRPIELLRRILSGDLSGGCATLCAVLDIFGLFEPGFVGGLGEWERLCGGGGPIY